MCYECCKCCQTFFESIYWHCFEKRWCYDEDIALYEEEPGMVVVEEKNSDFAFDNMAFYDSVAVIAGRSIVTIQPLHSENFDRKKSDTKSPPNVQWVDEESGGPKPPKRPANVLPIIHELRTSEIPATKPTPVPEMKINTPTLTDAEAADLGTLSPEEVNKNRTRRPSLQQRRLSKIALTLRLDANAELPIIRQNSMPKFYLDTPEPNQNDSSILRTPSMALTSPVVPKLSAFDLRSVVQQETQSKLQHTVSQASRIAQIRDKFKKPLLLRRQASNSNIPNSINHM